jgi:hypothetical protein
MLAGLTPRFKKVKVGVLNDKTIGKPAKSVLDAATIATPSGIPWLGNGLYYVERLSNKALALGFAHGAAFVSLATKF